MIMVLMTIMEESKMNCPCKECKDRFVTEHYSCHAICNQYKEWSKNQRIETMNLIRKKSLDNDSYSIADAKAIRKNNRRNKI